MTNSRPIPVPPLLVSRLRLYLPDDGIVAATVTAWRESGQWWFWRWATDWYSAHLTLSDGRRYRIKDTSIDGLVEQLEFLLDSFGESAQVRAAWEKVLKKAG